MNVTATTTSIIEMTNNFTMPETSSQMPILSEKATTTTISNNSISNDDGNVGGGVEKNHK